MTKILAFSGSMCKGSYNQAVVTAAAKGAQAAGAEVKVISLADYDMPIFSEDLQNEQGIPTAAQAFKELMMEHDGFLIASPEYNSAYPAVLKNALDWASRQSGDEAPMAAYKNKVAGIMAASPGGLGGMRVLVVLRMLLSNVGTLVIPNQKAVGKAYSLVNDQGEINDEATLNDLMAIGKQVAETAQKLKD
jgi:NAD(P)H-dependent FMN reductase